MGLTQFVDIQAAELSPLPTFLLEILLGHLSGGEGSRRKGIFIGDQVAGKADAEKSNGATNDPTHLNLQIDLAWLP
jgi:hypothetical protein